MTFATSASVVNNSTLWAVECQLFFADAVQIRGNDLVELCWKYEGAAWNAPVEIGKSVYRLNNPNAAPGAYQFAPNIDGREFLIRISWK